MRTRPARSTLSRASETVGLDRPDTRASSAREQGPRWRMCASRSCSFIARISEGRAANRTAPEFSGGGSAEADKGEDEGEAGEAEGAGDKPGADSAAAGVIAVTATSSTIV